MQGNRWDWMRSKWTNTRFFPLAGTRWLTDAQHTEMVCGQQDNRRDGWSWEHSCAMVPGVMPLTFQNYAIEMHQNNRQASLQVKIDLC